MSMSRAKNAEAHADAIEALRKEGLLPAEDSVQIRVKLIGIAYRPDRSAEQIISFCKELETYVVSG